MFKEVYENKSNTLGKIVKISIRTEKTRKFGAR
jgi:hypothetical protein